MVFRDRPLSHQHCMHDAVSLSMHMHHAVTHQPPMHSQSVSHTPTVHAHAPHRHQATHVHVCALTAQSRPVHRSQGCPGTSPSCPGALAPSTGTAAQWGALVSTTLRVALYPLPLATASTPRSPSLHGQTTTAAGAMVTLQEPISKHQRVAGSRGRKRCGEQYLSV
jgi:hypothetical protein